MKIKTILITAVVLAGAGGAASYYVKRSQETNAVKVEVVPVPSVNSAEYGLMDEGTISGTIISKDTQVVTLDTSHELVDVYVQQGDKVKKGDKLLEYDMLGDELKAEMEELTKLGLELTLDNMKKDLETLRSGRLPDSMTGGGDDSDDSADAGDDDDDDDDIGFSDDYSDESDYDENVDADGRSYTAGITRQGGGAVGSADISSIIEDPDDISYYDDEINDDEINDDEINDDEINDDDPYVDNDTSYDESSLDDIPLGQTLIRESLISALQARGFLVISDGEDEGQIAGEDEQFLYESFVNLLLSETVDGAAIEKILDLETDNEALAAFLSKTVLEGKVEEGLSLQEVFDAIGQSETGTQPDDTGFGNEIPSGFIEGDKLGNTEIPDAPFGVEAVPLLISAASEENDPDMKEPETESDQNDQGSQDNQAYSQTFVEEEDASDSPAGDSLPEDAVVDSGSENGTNVSAMAGGEPDDETEAPPEYDIADLDIAIDDESTADSDYDIIEEINEFLATVNEITLAVENGWGEIPSQIDAINEALKLFRETYADSEQYQMTDLFGDAVIVTEYLVSEDVTEQVGDATAKVLQEAYDRLCAYHFINTMLELNPDSLAGSAIDEAWVKENDEALRAAVFELVSLPESLWIYNPDTGGFEFRAAYAAMNNAIFSGDSMVSFLEQAVQATVPSTMVEEAADVQPVITQKGKFYNLSKLSGDGDDDDGDGYGLSAEELAELIDEQEKNIKETELQIREAELGIKEYQEILDGKIVYATMDGIVKNAGSTSGSSFITITGKAGLYVRGTVNELALDTVKVGDTITGTSYETGSSFKAEIVEISEYPDESNNSYYGGFGDENTNSSYYPFLAYIEDADGLEVDSYVDLSLSENGLSDSTDPEVGSGLCLEEYFIRKDNSGRSYCYVLGEDGLLSKRYLEVGANIWGYITVKSGLTPDDYIAFPYGDGVEEGAQTVKVESLTAIEGEEY